MLGECCVDTWSDPDGPIIYYLATASCLIGAMTDDDDTTLIYEPGGITISSWRAEILRW